MAARYDILVDVVDNDIQWVESDKQHITDTLNAAPGWWKEHPQDGVAIRRYTNSSGMEQVLAREITIQLESDNYQVSSPTVYFDTNGKLVVYPNATI